MENITICLSQSLAARAMEETGRLLSEINRAAQGNAELTAHACNCLTGLAQALQITMGNGLQQESDDGRGTRPAVDACEAVGREPEADAVAGQEPIHTSSRPPVPFDYSIQSLLNANTTTRTPVVGARILTRHDQRDICSTHGDICRPATLDYNMEINKEKRPKRQPEGGVMLMPSNPAFLSTSPMMCVSPAQNDQRIIENSVAWKFIGEFFGGNIKFPALLILIEEIRNVQMIPFKKCKNMRKADLIKWLDDHWSLILPFFQALSPDEKARMWGYLSG